MMSEELPKIFNVTIKIRATYNSVLERASDADCAHDMSIKNLQYILRCQMSDIRLYRPSSGTSLTSEPDPGSTARLNFARLYKQCDPLNILPSPALGIIRSTYPMAPLPIPSQMRRQLTTIERQRDAAIEAIEESCQSFVIYFSNYGINEAVSLPTMSVVLLDLTSASSLAAIARLRELFDPFNFSAMLIRVAEGEFNSIGQVWYYPRVPMGSSISAGEDVTAGTLGGFCCDPSSGKKFAITAGHAAGKPAGRTVYAPASKPFAEAVKSIQVRIDECNKKGQDPRIWTEKYDELQSLNRIYGKSVISSQRTTETGQIIDCALLSIEPARVADNRIGKIPEFQDQFVEFAEVDGDKIVPLTSPLLNGEKVWKLGIRTRLTSGTVIDSISLRWDAENVTAVSDYSLSPLCKATAVLGEWDPEEGVFQDFALPGDSGSFLLRLVPDPDESVPSEAVVIRTECGGVVFGIVWEESRKAYVTVYMPMERVMAEIKDQTGLTMSLNVPDASETSWPYVVMGRGRSMHGLH
jgi:hypothetical protein